jgi:hypothetical protein
MEWMVVIIQIQETKLLAVVVREDLDNQRHLTYTVERVVLVNNGWTVIIMLQVVVVVLGKILAVPVVLAVAVVAVLRALDLVDLVEDQQETLVRVAQQLQIMGQ